jgi:hypothetical protein
MIINGIQLVEQHQLEIFVCCSFDYNLFYKKKKVAKFALLLLPENVWSMSRT